MKSNFIQKTFRNHYKDHHQQGEMTSGLDNSLAPLVKLTHYSGLLYDWCIPVKYNNKCWNRFVASFQTMMVFASLFVSISAMALYSIRLGVVFSNLSDGSRNFLPSVIMFSTLPLVFLTQMIFLLRRSALLTFFVDWRQELNDIDHNKTSTTTGLEKKIILIYCIYLSFIILSVGAFGIIVLNNKQIMDDWASGIAFGPYVRSVKCLLFGSFLNVSIFFSLIDIVPSFVYYQAGVAVRVLVNRWESILHQRDSAKVQQIISLYNSIGSLATRADCLFGPLIVLNHGTTFLFICILTSTLLKPSLWTQSDFLVLFGNLVFFLARLVWPIMFQSKLYDSSERLKAIVLSSYSESSITVAENHFNKKLSNATSTATDKSIKKFAFLIVNKSLAACPSGLYNITPSIFLTMLSLLASYTIIILQSQ